MKTLAELNPAVGDTITYKTDFSSPTYTVLAKDPLGYTLLSQESHKFTEPTNSVCGKQQRWSITSKAPMKTVAELNLKVGDRIQSGDRTGTVVGVSVGHYLNVIWDWNTQYAQYPLDFTVNWTLLPKPEPTLASLGLKAGDPVLNTRNGRCALVYSLCDPYVNIRYCCGDTLTLFLADPAHRLKKLEVPK